MQRLLHSKAIVKKNIKNPPPSPFFETGSPWTSLAGQTGLKLREILSTGAKGGCYDMWLCACYSNSGSRFAVRIGVSAVRNGQEKTYVLADVLDLSCVESRG